MESSWCATPYEAGILMPWEAIQLGFEVPRVLLASPRVANPSIIVTNIRKPSTNQYWVYQVVAGTAGAYGFTGLTQPIGIHKFPWGEAVVPP